jgi:hypothetical protein
LRRKRKLLDIDEVRQGLDTDGASREPLDTDARVTEGAGVSGPLEPAVGVGLDDGQVVEEVDDGLLLSGALALLGGEGVADQQLAAVVRVSDALEHGSKVNLLSAALASPLVSLVGQEKSCFGNGQAGDGSGADGDLGGGQAGDDGGGAGPRGQSQGGEHEGGGGASHASEQGCQKGLHGAVKGWCGKAGCNVHGGAKVFIITEVRACVQGYIGFSTQYASQYIFSL